MAQGSASSALAKQAAMNDMQNFVLSLYPGLRSQTYCVPPCIMNRVPYDRSSYCGQPVLVQKCLQTMCGQSDHVSLPATSNHTKRPLSPQAEPQICKQLKTRPDKTAAIPQSMWPEQNHSHDTPSPTQVDKGAIHSDFAQQHVLHCLKELGDRQNETMFIISELKFRDYLGKLTADAAHQFPRPRDLLDKHDRDGDFDIIIIHRLYGVLVGEIKSSGLRFEPAIAESEWPLAAASVSKHVFSRDIKSGKAADQLEKAERVVKHNVGDIAPDLKVRKIIILPYVRRQQLQDMLENRGKEFRECVAGPGAEAFEAAQLCLTADDLSDRTSPWDITDSVFEKLQAWFERCMASCVDPAMTDEVYLDLVARFVGPATSVTVHCNSRPRICMEVRTAGEAVSHIGEMLAQLVLTPEQLSILNEAPPMVCLVGPPGTGKTIVLVLIGLYWLLLGHSVYILCCSKYCLAVSRLIKWQIEKTYKQLRDPEVQQSVEVKILELHLYENDDCARAAVREVQTASKSCGGPHLLMDEAPFSNRKEVGQRCHNFIRDLSGIQGLHLWAATADDDNRPKCLQRVCLKVPLRSAPAVLREVKKGLNSTYNAVPDYSCRGVPAPSDGPPVKWVIHRGDDHAGKSPVDCKACGRRVARILRQDLHVGVDGPSLDVFSSNGENTITRPPPLHYRDVYVLSRSTYLQRGLCGFVQGFTEPVVVGDTLYDEIPINYGDCVLGEEDTVAVANLKEVRGLERKIVVCLPGRIDCYDDQKSDRDLEMRDRLWVASRCSTQLIMVKK